MAGATLCTFCCLRSRKCTSHNSRSTRRTSCVAACFMLQMRRCDIKLTNEVSMLNPWVAHYEPGVPPTLEYPAVTLHGLLEQTAERYPERLATIFFGAKLSYRALNEAA